MTRLGKIELGLLRHIDNNPGEWVYFGDALRAIYGDAPTKANRSTLYSAAHSLNRKGYIVEAEPGLFRAVRREGSFSTRERSASRC